MVGGSPARLPSIWRNIISFCMAHAHSHRHPVSESPGWSLLRLSAAGRLGLALAAIMVLWAATLAVIA